MSEPIEVESWIWYGFVTLVVGVRLYVLDSATLTHRWPKQATYDMQYFSVHSPEIFQTATIGRLSHGSCDSNDSFFVSNDGSVSNLFPPKCLYTILIVLLNYVAEVQTNLIAPEDLPNLNPENIAARVRGSKMVLALETCMCCVIWLCKSCILLLYYKLTYVLCLEMFSCYDTGISMADDESSYRFGLAQNIIVKVTGAYVVFSFVVMMILYFAV